MSGMLFICATPLGNLEDITIRALNTFKSVDIIAAEDTRNTIKLLNFYNIKTPLTSYHEHNKLEKGKKIIQMLKDGKNIALVSDAGMPAISDPGEDLIRLCYENDINVTAVPGATAEVTALVLSCISARSYCFEGFLPINKKSREEVIKRLKTETRTTIFYEAPHHLINTLKCLYNNIGNRNIAVAREITKKHESVIRGNMEEVINYFTDNEPKGEIVIIIEGISRQLVIEEERKAFDKITVFEHVNSYIDKGMSEKDAMKQASKDRGVSKSVIYKQYIAEKNIY